jgi:hypothetical protein
MMHPDRHARSKVQAAMEYLMTYGWAIVIIAVVVMIIYEMKLSSPSLPTSCLSTEPWLCRNPTLRTNGILSVQLGILGSTITIIDLNCSPSGVMPSSWTTPSPATLVSGVPVILNFSCPISSNTVGTSFAGRLWIIYNTPTQTGLIAQVGSVSAQAVGVGIPSNVVASPFYFLTMSSNPSAAAASLSPGTGYYTGTLTISASANPGYTFSSWTGTGTGSYAGNALSNTIMLSNNVTETANFVPLPFQFSANVLGSGGTVSCASAGAVNALCMPANYLYGNTITVYATNSYGYALIGWSGCGTWCSYPTSNTVSVAIPASNAVITAGFAVISTTCFNGALVSATVNGVSCSANALGNGTVNVTFTYVGPSGGSATWTVPSGIAYVNYLVVAGGGGGGRSGTGVVHSGGGGAGGFLTGNILVTSGNVMTVTVGTGGAGATTQGYGANGANSVFGNLIAIGGGGGAYGNCGCAGHSGGSGGGGGYSGGGGGAGTAGQGNNGGTASSASPWCGGGGGGAGAVGGSTPNGIGGNGLSSSISGTLVTYAGGGGGALGTGINAGGSGGGGAGGSGSGNVPVSGTNGLGGGGGGDYNNAYNGGNGGSGIVILSYTANLLYATAGTGGSISCVYTTNSMGTPCVGSYPGTQITVIATNTFGYSFSSWSCTPSAACSSTSTQTTVVTVTSGTIVTANFLELPTCFVGGIGPATVNGVSCVATNSSSNSIVTFTYVGPSGGSATWTVPSGITYVNYLVVAGGGGGGRSASGNIHSGGGGAGGFLAGTLAVTSGNVMTVTVGTGGAGATTTGYGANGANSVFGNLIAIGGGGGAYGGSSAAGQSGGSGGGGGYSGGGGGAGTAGQGNNGGTASGDASPFSGGGGGGAGAVGGSTPNGIGGNGLSSSISGTLVTYAGGGGGALGTGTNAGGSGGGGSGGNAGGAVPVSGTNGLGGGGGGDYNNAYNGGNGGTGIVILSYVGNLLTATAGTGGSISCQYTTNSIGTSCIGSYPGMQITVIATNTFGYYFSGWTCAPSIACSSTSSQTTVVTVTTGTVVTASFLEFPTCFVGGIGPATVNGVSCAATNSTGNSIVTFAYVGPSGGSATWTVPNGLAYVNYLVVAGGGGGGRSNSGNVHSGGGGAGGFLTGNLAVTPGNVMTVTVGTGGAGATTTGYGANGANSVFGNIIAIGGGGGAYGGSSAAGHSGGSGGGGGYSGGGGGAGTAGQGNNGGTASSASPWCGGGGGGAGAVGGSTPNGIGGNGLSSSISGTLVTYAGGGGGALGTGTNAGGSGGGGSGGNAGGAVPVSGTNGLGGGGGGDYNNAYNGGNGGSGIVIISHP